MSGEITSSFVRVKCDCVKELTRFWDGKIPEEPTGNRHLVVSVVEE